MKPVLVQTLPITHQVRDAAFLGEDSLILTDPSANLWRYSLESGQVELFHRGTDVMASFPDGVQPAGGTYPGVAASPNGETLVVNTHDLVLMGRDAAGGPWRCMYEQWGAFYPELQFSPDGEHFAAWSEFVVVFDVRGLQYRGRALARACAWHPSRPLLLCADSDTLGWLDLEKLQGQTAPVSPKRIGALVGPGEPGDVMSMVILHDGRLAVAIEQGHLEFWQLEPLRRLDRLQTRGENLYLKSAPGGRWFALEGTAGVELWDATSPVPVSELLPAQTGIRISPSGRRFVTLGPMDSHPLPGSGGGRPVTLWELPMTKS
jgi:WD40 repeat protein